MVEEAGLGGSIVATDVAKMVAGSTATAGWRAKIETFEGFSTSEGSDLDRSMQFNWHQREIIQHNRSHMLHSQKWQPSPMQL